VAQALGHGLDVDACLEQERRMRVSEAVESDRRNHGQIADAPHEAPADDVRIRRLAPWPTEDEVKIGSVGVWGASICIRTVRQRDRVIAYHPRRSCSWPACTFASVSSSTCF